VSSGSWGAARWWAATSTVAAVTVALAPAAVAHKPVQRHVHSTAGAHVIYTAPWPSVPIITPRYIYYPGAAPDPNAPPMPADCATTGQNCTDVELCELWGQC